VSVVTIFVGQPGLRNLQVGLAQGVWGFKSIPKDLHRVRPGDIVLLGAGYSGGSPRVKLDEWIEGSLGRIEVGVITSDCFEDDEPVWPDEQDPDVSYRHRFRFRHAGQVENVPLGPGGGLGRDVADGFRLSAVNHGWAYVIDSPENFSLDVPIPEADEVPPPLAEAPDEPEIASMSDVLTSFERALSDAGLVFPPQLPLRFLCGLVAKPFVILTGLSGSGKTQLALALGRWIGSERCFVSPVRPDWTGAEALFGYENLLLPPTPDGRMAWTVPKELEFMLRAADDPTEPYLLVLDEMNLAHVERYFADVLSGMESRTPVLPNLAVDPDGTWRRPGDGPDRIPFPDNLLVVGTVNVDETTYQFSPKVLDRSTSIEFRVGTETLTAEPANLARIEPGAASARRALIQRPGPERKHEVTPEVAKALDDLHSLLASHGREFGHRSYQEMLRFAAIAQEARPSLQDHELLDCLVMQKVLPRIHGSARELTPLVSELSAWISPSDEPGSRPELPLSAEKLGRMQRELDATHFTAF
jgi:5-methylcytosine-specific restriction enzyme B